MIISIWSTKGGTGTSTVALALAQYLQSNSKQVALIDANLYSSTLTAMLEVEETHYGFDRLFMYRETELIQKAMRENWVKVKGLELMPGMKFPPDEVDTVWAKKVSENITGKEHIVIDAGWGLLNPLQKELLLRSDFIVVVVTPLIFTYHRLWEHWQHEFFTPNHLSRKTGVIVNRHEGPVSTKDIATLMNVVLLGDLPHEKHLMEQVNLGQINFSGKFMKRMGQAWNILKKHAESSSTIVPSAKNKITHINYESNPVQPKMDAWPKSNTDDERREWTFEP
ncbi:hypothetical protein GCM10010965_27600 [Caldalkalibacillus thermarum]|uniref:AAA family ATPase n=1 Tax=Caldalkalibacillus thermarum TaxID=296745 RepID=UPI0016630D05|nr:P-loop NTPase [Caldalkalibacillus thermarum]GGK33219.1 hypothetical protein GCM10010965_27600 [Caldalkalibacillus thermarum]